MKWCMFCAIIFSFMSLLMTAMAFRVVTIPSHASIVRGKAENETGEIEVNHISNTTNASTVASSDLSFGLVQTSMAAQTNAYTKAENASNFESGRLWTSQGVDHQSLVAMSSGEVFSNVTLERPELPCSYFELVNNCVDDCPQPACKCYVLPSLTSTEGILCSKTWRKRKGREACDITGRFWVPKETCIHSPIVDSAEAAGSGVTKGAAGNGTPESVVMKGAAGHDGVFVKILSNGEPTGQVGKKWDGNTEKEFAFYNLLQGDAAGKELVPRFVAKVESQPQTVGGFQRMVMTDFLFNMPDPSCVMDFKIGKITYDPDSIKDKAKLPIEADRGTNYEGKVMKEFGKFTEDELSKKRVIDIQRESGAEPETLDKDQWVTYAEDRKKNAMAHGIAPAGGITKGQYHRIIDALTGSSERGYRLDGVSVNGHRGVEQELRKLGKIAAGKEMKEGCRTIKNEDDIIKWIDTALGVTGDNKARVQKELVKKLASLHKALRTNGFVKQKKFIGSSVLLIFNEDQADVKWIDFAHAGPAGPVDHVELLNGIESLRKTVSKV